MSTPKDQILVDYQQALELFKKPLSYEQLKIAQDQIDADIEALLKPFLQKGTLDLEKAQLIANINQGVRNILVLVGKNPTDKIVKEAEARIQSDKKQAIAAINNYYYKCFEHIDNHSDNDNEEFQKQPNLLRETLKNQQEALRKALEEKEQWLLGQIRNRANEQQDTVGAMIANKAIENQERSFGTWRTGPSVDPEKFGPEDIALLKEDGNEDTGDALRFDTDESEVKFKYDLSGRTKLWVKADAWVGGKSFVLNRHSSGGYTVEGLYKGTVSEKNQAVRVEKLIIVFTAMKNQAIKDKQKYSLDLSTVNYGNPYSGEIKYLVNPYNLDDTTNDPGHQRLKELIIAAKCARVEIVDEEKYLKLLDPTQQPEVEKIVNDFQEAKQQTPTSKSQSAKARVFPTVLPSDDFKHLEDLNNQPDDKTKKELFDKASPSDCLNVLDSPIVSEADKKLLIEHLLTKDDQGPLRLAALMDFICNEKTSSSEKITRLLTLINSLPAAQALQKFKEIWKRLDLETRYLLFPQLSKEQQYAIVEATKLEPADCASLLSQLSQEQLYQFIFHPQLDFSSKQLFNDDFRPIFQNSLDNQRNIFRKLTPATLVNLYQHASKADSGQSTSIEKARIFFSNFLYLHKEFNNGEDKKLKAFVQALAKSSPQQAAEFLSAIYTIPSAERENLHIHTSFLGDDKLDKDTIYYLLQSDDPLLTASIIANISDENLCQALAKNLSKENDEQTIHDQAHKLTATIETEKNPEKEKAERDKARTKLAYVIGQKFAAEKNNINEKLDENIGIEKNANWQNNIPQLSKHQNNIQQIEKSCQELRDQLYYLSLGQDPTDPNHHNSEMEETYKNIAKQQIAALTPQQFARLLSNTTTNQAGINIPSAMQKEWLQQISVEKRQQVLVECSVLATDLKEHATAIAAARNNRQNANNQITALNQQLTHAHQARQQAEEKRNEAYAKLDGGNLHLSGLRSQLQTKQQALNQQNSVQQQLKTELSQLGNSLIEKNTVLEEIKKRERPANQADEEEAPLLDNAEEARLQDEVNILAEMLALEEQITKKKEELKGVQTIIEQIQTDIKTLTQQISEQKKIYQEHDTEANQQDQIIQKFDYELQQAQQLKQHAKKYTQLYHNQDPIIIAQRGEDLRKFTADAFNNAPLSEQMKMLRAVQEPTPQHTIERRVNFLREMFCADPKNPTAKEKLAIHKKLVDILESKEFTLQEKAHLVGVYYQHARGQANNSLYSINETMHYNAQRKLLHLLLDDKNSVTPNYAEIFVELYRLAYGKPPHQSYQDIVEMLYSNPLNQQQKSQLYMAIKDDVVLKALLKFEIDHVDPNNNKDPQYQLIADIIEAQIDNGDLAAAQRLFSLLTQIPTIAERQDNQTEVFNCLAEGPRSLMSPLLHKNHIEKIIKTIPADPRHFNSAELVRYYFHPDLNDKELLRRFEQLKEHQDNVIFNSNDNSYSLHPTFVDPNDKRDFDEKNGGEYFYQIKKHNSLQEYLEKVYPQYPDTECLKVFRELNARQQRKIQHRLSDLDLLRYIETQEDRPTNNKHIAQLIIERYQYAKVDENTTNRNGENLGKLMTEERSLAIMLDKSMFDNQGDIKNVIACLELAKINPALLKAAFVAQYKGSNEHILSISQQAVILMTLYNHSNKVEGLKVAHDLYKEMKEPRLGEIRSKIAELNSNDDENSVDEDKMLQAIAEGPKKLNPPAVVEEQSRTQFKR